MARIQPLTLDTVTPDARASLQAVKAKVGKIPNLYATIAHSPAALTAYLGFSESLASGRLSPAQREIIALAVGQANGCQYCVSAHSLLAKHAGLSDTAIAQARVGKSEEPLNHGLATLAAKLIKQKAVLSHEDLSAAAQAGIDHGLVIEVLAVVVMNIFTNYTNHLAETDIDFPLVAL